MAEIIIFDWDGTLVDSTGRIVDCVHRSADLVGVSPVTDQQAKHIIGLGLPEAIRTLWPDINSENHAAMCQAYAKFFSEGSEIGVSFYKGVPEFLQKLKNMGLLLGVATGKTRKGLDAMITDMDVEGVFDITRCADETCSKPHPQMLSEILDEHKLQAERALMIGDTTYDLEMAYRISMPSIGMLYGAHEREMLERWAPKALCHNVSELETFIENYLNA